MVPASATPFPGDGSVPDRAASSQLLEIDVRTDTGDPTTTVVARGEVDLSTRAQLADALDAALGRILGTGSPESELVVDLRLVGFIDCGGTEVVAETVRTALAHRVSLRVLPGPALDDLVALVGGWDALVVESDAVRVDGRAAREPEGAPGDRGTVSEYDHLAPLLAERGRLPAAHPRQRALRAELIAGYLPVAQHIARRHRSRGEDLDDLEQVATIGLINAVDRFDVTRGVDFLAFAIPTITGEVQRHYRDRTSTIRVPRRVRQLQGAVQHAVDELSRRHGTAPRPSAVARHLDVDISAVLEALEANTRTWISSLDEPFGGDEAGGDNPRHAGALGVADTDLELIDDRESLRALLDALPGRDQRIVLLRFFGNQTQSQIAEQLGISQMHVSRLLSAALGQLREGMNKDARQQR